MISSLDPLAVAEHIACLASRFDVKTLLHIGPRTGFLGAALRQALDFQAGRLNPCDRRARITALVDSGASLPFGFCYDVVEAEPPRSWLGSHPARFDLILATCIPLELEREEARALLRLLYDSTDKLLLTVVHNDLTAPYDPELERRYTMQLASADFPRIGYTEIGRLALAAVRNEFLPL